MSPTRFELESAIQAANQAVISMAGRPLSDVETLILKGAWERLDYDQIAAQNQYATTYVSNDIAPKLWRTLTQALGEKVKKSNFKAALKRYWETEFQAAQSGHHEPLNVVVRSSSNPETAPLTSALPQTEQVVAAPHPSEREVIATDIHSTYVKRPPIETVSYETVMRPGSLLRIKAPKYMGKTALVNWLITQVTPQGYRTVTLSFEMADRRKHFADLNQFLRWFCVYISRQLGLPGELEEYWDEECMGAKVSCTTYFEEYLLPQATAPLMLCLDDVDTLFPYPEIYEDFFGLLRSWYEKARSRRVWQNLRLVFAHATDVYIRLNLHQSPFNVGVPVSLPDFTPEQSCAFAQTFHLPETVDTLQPLLNWINGHPYLLQLAFNYQLHHPTGSLTDLLPEIATEAGIYSAHLRDLLLNLREDDTLGRAMKQVVNAEAPVKLEAIAAYKLQSMGLIELSGNLAQPRCQLYRVYFADRLEGA